jgi:hypothetical protein
LWSPLFERCPGVGGTDYLGVTLQVAPEFLLHWRPAGETLLHFLRGDEEVEFLCQEVDPRTMASRLVPGLFFCGEALDLDADTGGYNLQAAFSTGYVAGEEAARRKIDKNLSLLDD